MNKTLRKYKGFEGKASKKFLRLFFISIIAMLYCYILLIWKPSTYVSLLETTGPIQYLKIAVTIILAVILAVRIDIEFLRAKKYNEEQIRDYELWNKFFLHFAFLKTGSGSEKAQVMEVLRYLEDSELKQTLTDIYEENATIKDAHNQIVLKYPYPQVKTFFAESEDALVKGADGNRLMQKTALYIDKYINDITVYQAEKKNNYLMSMAFLIVVTILTLLVKLFFAGVFIDFAGTLIGFIVLIAYLITIVNLFIKVKREVNKPLINFGGEDNE